MPVDLLSSPVLLAAVAGALGAVAAAVLGVAVQGRDASVRWRISEQERLWGESANLRTAVLLELERLRRNRQAEEERWREQLAAVTARVGDLETALRTRDARITVLEAEVQVRDARIGLLETEVSRLRAQIENVE